MAESPLATSMGDLSRWHPRDGYAQQPPFIDTLRVEAASSLEEVDWRLPPSKSHLIRWLLMASQAPVGQITELHRMDDASEDALAMSRCLSQMGVKIQGQSVHGAGVDGFCRPASVLHCDNSGTTLNLLTGLASRLDFPVMLDGDATLRRRGSPAFWAQLKQNGVEVSHGFAEETLPLLVHGPIQPQFICLDAGRTSQHLSALILASAGFSSPLNVKLEGDLVSRRHAQLSVKIANACGARIEISSEMELSAWQLTVPDSVTIPTDASHISFAKLFELVHGVGVDYEPPAAGDALGAELLFDLDFAKAEQEIDLRDANDLITPLAASLCVGAGGRITGASHATHKESNRIQRTVELLACFGLEVEATEDGLICPPGQVLAEPDGVVPTFGDHRQFMTAVVLASVTGGRIEGSTLHRVSHPAFLEVLESAGVVFKAKRIQP